jgi:hypothetical protein
MRLSVESVRSRGVSPSRTFWTLPSPKTSILSRGSLDLQSICSTALTTVLVLRSLSSLGLPRLLRFSRCRVAFKLAFEHILSWSFVPPQSVMLWRRCHQKPVDSFLSCGSAPLRRIHDARQPPTPQKKPPSGLRGLLSVSHALKASIRLTPFGRVRADSAHGVFPSRLFSFAEPPTLSSGSALLKLLIGPIRQPQPHRAFDTLGLADSPTRLLSRRLLTQLALFRALIPTNAGLVGLHF